MEDFAQTLESFFTSEDFKQGVISSMKASWSGSCYKVELMLGGTWRVLWENEIGNKYETPGIVLRLPTMDDSEVQKYLVATGDTLDNVLGEQFIVEEEDLKVQMREGLEYALS